MLACIYICAPYQCPVLTDNKEGIRFSGTGITDDRELLRSSVFYFYKCGDGGGTYGGQKRVLAHMLLELEVSVSCPMCVLGTKLGLL